MNLMVPELRGILARGLRPLTWIVVLIGLGASSCNTTKYLADDEELLTSYRVKIADPKSITKRADVIYELGTLARQQPNDNFLFLFPREYFYLDNNKPKDTTRIDRFLRSTIGQPPTIYNDSLSRRSAAEMADYLRYLGYFNALAYHEADRGKRRKVDLIYHVRAGRRYVIDSVAFTSELPLMDSLLQQALPESELKPGEPLDLNRFDQEKARLSRYFRNNGFAYFSGAYFDKLEIDTSRRRGYADVYLSILPPKKLETYEQYHVGRVTVFTDYSPLEAPETYALDTMIDGVRFLSNNPHFKLRADVLRDAIFLQPGELHQRSDLERTNLALNGLGIYRFVRVNQTSTGEDDNIIDYAVQLTPSDRMSIGADLDFNYTNRNGGVGAGNLVGIGVTPSYQNKNLFGGAELLSLNIRAGVEINPLAKARDSILNTVDLAASLSLYVPRFKDFGGYRFLNRLPGPFGGRMLSSKFLAELQERASTRYSLGYEYLSIRDFYSYNLLNARLGYDFNRSATTSYRINHLAIDILNPTIEPQFDVILDSNEFLRRSIGEQYFFSALFRNIEYSRQGVPDRRGRSLTFNGQLEVAGAEVYAVNELYNIFSEIKETFVPRDGATFAKYVLGLAEVRYLKEYTPQRAFAARLLLAAGRPYGGSEAVPYVKQFFAGGANSMRAWQPRGLGPGGYVDPLSLTSEDNLRLFQTGDFRMELNAELRFPLYSFFRGAIFTDVGNIWTLENDPERPGSQFLFAAKKDADGTVVNQPFWRQLAVASGFGLRADLSYFIFRADVAIPVRFNYPVDASGNQLIDNNGPVREADYWQRFGSFGFRTLTFQLGLGYPF